MVAYERLKTTENFKLFKCGRDITLERWSLTRGFKYRDFGKLVAEEMWSQPEVRLYDQLIMSVGIFDPYEETQQGRNSCRTLWCRCPVKLSM